MKPGGCMHLSTLLVLKKFPLPQTMRTDCPRSGYRYKWRQILLSSQFEQSPELCHSVLCLHLITRWTKKGL